MTAQQGRAYHRPMANFQTQDEVRALVKAAGGPSELARRMGFDKRGGRQRVGNWQAAGRIPEMTVKAYGVLFKRILKRAQAHQPAEKAIQE